MFSASVSIALKKTAPLPNTAPLDNWYNVDQEHCIFESMNRAYLPSALPYSEDAAYSASPNSGLYCGYSAELRIRIQPSELVRLFSNGSISFLNCFTTSNAAVGLFGKYS